MTTLYDYLKMNKSDYDTYDTEYDAVITVCYIDCECDDYDKFCNAIIKKVDVVKAYNYGLTVNWSNLIKRNMDKFRAFAMKHWAFEYEDEDEFIYQWVKEIHYYIAGYVSIDFYSVLNEFVDGLE